ncbi:MAG TPA: acyl-CoA dehydrogenase family protein [Acidimicrobiales bacterium]|nr:acyl-CoA dehydrogenase family protein [Acidimicrobiales bacterium]
MHLEFTDEQLELRESARAILSRECPPRLVREVAVSGGEAEGFRSQLSWLGWPALTIDVDLGGLGRSFIELAVVLEELGRAAAPGPFLATMTQFVPAVREAGSAAQVSRFLSAVAAGQLNGTLALYEGGRWDPFSIGATAARDGDGWVLSGHKRQVLCCAEVDEIVVAARRASGTLALFVVPAADVTFARVESIDGTRSLGNLELDGVWVPDARMLGDPDVAVDATPAVAATIAEATVGMALDTVGVCGALFQSSLEAALDLPVRSLSAEPEAGEANGDTSTGPNGSNGAAGASDRAASRNGDQPVPTAPNPVRTPPQAVKHSLAEMATALERTRAIVYQATAAAAERHERATVTASQAKAAAGACQRLIIARSLEIHGRGSRRADAQLWVRRAQAGELLLGSSADHRRVVADELFRVPKRQPASAGLAAVLGL